VGTLRGSLGCDSSPKSMSKGARFLGFPSSKVSGVLGENFFDSSFLDEFWLD
jgi:hypothetical protein